MANHSYLYSKTAISTVNRHEGIVSLATLLAAEEFTQKLTGLKSLQVHEEFKLVLPEFIAQPLPVKEQWTLYLKRSDFAHKSMCSHPTENEWVGSIIVPNRIWENFLTSLEQSFLEKSEWRFDDLGRLSFPNNFKLIIKHR